MLTKGKKKLCAYPKLFSQIQELEEKEQEYIQVKDVGDSQENMCDTEHLKEQLETQKSVLANVEMENIQLNQRLQENLEEMRSVSKERDDLRAVSETLRTERDQLKENLRESVTKVSYRLARFW